MSRPVHDWWWEGDTAPFNLLWLAHELMLLERLRLGAGTKLKLAWWSEAAVRQAHHVAQKGRQSGEV